ncbi:MAG: hypothetical protein E7195_01790 [Peptococcaceae bacterium]|nr:hypothetical protein [Peptococcaceae bacterium]
MRLSKKTVAIILTISLCAMIYVGNLEANRIFPLDYGKIEVITVENEQTKPVLGPWTQRRMMGHERNKFVNNINQLAPVKKEKIGDVIKNEILNAAHYSVRIIYDPIKNPLRKNHVVRLYFFDDGRILADNDGYTMYEDTSTYYEEFLLFLEEMHVLCSVEDKVME